MACLKKVKHANKEHWSSGSAGKILHRIKLDRKRSRMYQIFTHFNLNSVWLK